MKPNIEPIDGSLIEPQDPVEETKKEVDPFAVYLCNKSENDDPEYAEPGASGMDIRADLSRINPDFMFNATFANNVLTLYPGGRALISTGLFIALPLGLEAQVRPRSGLALKHGITVLNSPGTIDSSYRGEIGVILVNQGTRAFDIRTGDRIAQLVIMPYAKVLQFAKVNDVSELPPSERMGDGFGSTGVK